MVDLISLAMNSVIQYALRQQVLRISYVNSLEIKGLCIV